MKGRTKKGLCIFMSFVMAFLLAVQTGQTGISYAKAKKTSVKAELSTKKLTLKVGQKEKITFKKKHKGSAKYTWKTSSKKIATVSNGIVKAKKKGNVTISCIVKPKNGKKYQLSTKIKVNKKKTVKPTNTPVVATKAPKASATPEVLETPVAATKEPEVTKAPEASATPEVTEAPKVSAAPTPISVVTAPASVSTWSGSTGGFAGNIIITTSEPKATVPPIVKETEAPKATVPPIVKETETPVQPKAEEANQKEAKQAEVVEKSEEPVQKNVPVIKEDKTRLLDLGFIQYVVVTYADGYNMDNTTTVVDGVDISEALTPVSDDRTVAKWEITSLNPASVTVTDKENNSVSQTVTLSDNENPTAPFVRNNTAPDYVMGYGSLAYWDYYLTNYDDAGNMRIHAGKTTFSLNGDTKKTNHPYYAPDTELTQGGSNVEIMFNYNTDAEKTWFDSIKETGALELVSFDEYKNVINGNLAYELSTEPHGKGTVGKISIPTGQGNFTTAGRYHVRIKPSADTAVLVNIHLVNETVPTMTLSESRVIEPGLNVHFHVENMVYGIKEPIEKAELTTPDGSVKELTFIDDYYLFGDLFVLYNDETRDDGKGINHTKDAGVYKITVYAEGYKPVSCQFMVTDNNKNLRGFSKAAVKENRYAVKMDAVSGATSVSASSGSGSSGGGNISANLIFNVDLYANAEIFDKLGFDNEYATKIAERYETGITNMIAVYSKDGENFYDFYDYFNAVQQAKIEGNYLTFANYKAQAGAKTVNKPSRVKEVLEDNLLGELIEDNSYYGNETQALNLVDSNGTAITSVPEGNDAYYISNDTEYMKKVDGVYTKEHWYAPLESGWKIENGYLIIDKSLLSLTSDNTFTVRAAGYKDIEISVPYEKTLENITLKATGEMITGKDVTISLEGSQGDFAAYLTEVVVNNGVKDKRVLTKSAGGDTGNDWYELNEDKTELVLKGGLFTIEGTYTLTLTAQYYGEITVSFDITQAAEDEDALDAPKVIKVTKQESAGWFGAGSVTYLVEFEKITDDAGAETDAQEYLRKIVESGVKVGDTNYTQALLSLRGTNYQATVKDAAYGGRNNCLKLGGDGFAEGQPTVVTIKADGYKTQSFTVTADGKLEGAEDDTLASSDNDASDETGSADDNDNTGDTTGSADDNNNTGDETDSTDDAPTSLPSITEVSYAGYIQLTNYNQDFTNWIASMNENTSVSVNGDNYTCADSSELYSLQQGKWIKGSTSLFFAKAAFTTGVNTIKIKVDGYKELTWYVTKTVNPYSGAASFDILLVNPNA